jgi:hypothetical protein
MGNGSGWRGKTTLLLTESNGGKRWLWLIGGPKGTASPKIAGAGDQWGAGDGAPMSRARERQGREAGLWLREGAQLLGLRNEAGWKSTGQARLATGCL